MSDIYREYLLDHYHNPKNKEKMPDADIQKRDINISCGDDVEMFIKLDNDEVKSKSRKPDIDGKKIAEIKFQGTGCVICMATASILTEEMAGKTISDIKKMNTDELLDMIKLQLTPTRVKCAMLPLVTMKKGILDYEARLLDDNAKG
ncbi:MAG TPA: iron-sulfur cluster assembly scaffold protein [Alphaproteobacteria bacterium]|nr:iron-sulfur cluster assembly scaffold protein [Alphaproteobacteria bacterium]